MKKILKISGISVAVIAVAALLATGILMLIQNRNVAKTGNVLGVSWYNETDKEFTLTTAEQLREFAKLSNYYTFEGQTIKLGADIILNEGNAEEWKENAPKERWKPITGFAGTFDGQGHSISGLYGKGYEVPMALFTDTSKDSTIQNVKLVNSYMETGGRSGTASFVVNGGGTLKQLYSDAIINHNGNRAAGIVSRPNATTNIEECWFDGSIDIKLAQAGGIVDVVVDERVTVKHCLFSGTITSPYVPYDTSRTNFGGICGLVDGRGSVTIQDCLSSGIINAESQVGTGSVVGYVMYGGNSKAIFQDSFASNKTAPDCLGAATGVLTGGSILTRESELLGVKAYQWTTLDFDNYWAAVENDTPVLKHFAKDSLSLEGVEKAYDTSWYSSSSYIYEIKDLADLYGLAFLSVGNNFSERRVKLAADIVVNEGNAKDWEKEDPANPWYPIRNFSGVFEGQGHTVSGVCLKNGLQNQGFFSSVNQGGVIRDFNLKNSYFCSTHETLTAIGSIAGGEFRGTLDTVYSDAIVVGYGQQIGGLIARSNDNDDSGLKEDTVIIKNCWFDGEVYAKGEETTYAAGIVSAVIQGDLQVLHCLNTGTIHSECINRAVHVAGLVGSVSHVEARLVMDDCLNVGKIEAAYDVGVGSVIGRLSGQKHSAKVTNTYTTKESHPTLIGTSGGIVYGGPIQLPESLLIGNSAYQYTDLDFEKNWAIVKNDTPILQTYATTVPSVKGLTKEVDYSWYNDEDTTFTIKNVKQLFGFALMASGNTFKDKTVKLGADIVVNKPNVEAWRAGTATPSKPWISTIGNMNIQFDGTFDGQGHTISGVYLKSDEQHTGLFGSVGYNGVVKNLKLTDSYFCNTNKVLCGTASIAGQFRGTMEKVYSNAIVEGYAQQIGGLIGRANDYDYYKGETPEQIADKITVKECWFDGEVRLIGTQNTYAGGVVGVHVQGDLEVIDCLNSGKIISEKNDKTLGITLHTAGLVGSESHAEARLTIKNSLNVGKIEIQPGMETASGSILGRVSANNKATIVNTFATKESHKDTVGYSNGTVDGKGTQLNRTELVLRTDAAVKEFFGPTTSAWTCDTVNNGSNRGTPILKYFASWWLKNQPATKEASDTSWYNTTDSEFTITTAEQLNGLAELSAKYTFEGQTFKLGKDIALTTAWSPIGTESKPFAGTFDGQGHEISGLYLDTSAEGAGFFGHTSGTAVLKNFKLVDSYMKSSGRALGLVGKGALSAVENVYTNATIEASASYTGGFVGILMPEDGVTTTFRNCWFDGEVTQLAGDLHSAGGFIGNDGKATPVIFKNCLSTGSVTGGFRVGGFYGWKNNYAINEFHNCLSTATVTATPSENYSEYDSYAGSYYGHHNTSTYNVKFYNSYTSGDKITGKYKNDAEAANYEISAYLKDRMELIETGEKKLFPALADEGQNAWVDDIGYNNTDRGTPILEYFADWWLAENPASGLAEMPGTKADTSWYNTTDTEFTLMNVEDLLGFAELVNAGTDNFAGKTVKLGADITVNTVDATILQKWVAGTTIPAIEWDPIGTNAKPFAGTFDGQGYAIKGLYLNSVTQGAGLFGRVAYSAEIENLKLLDSYMKSTADQFGLVGSGILTRIENVYTNAIMVAEGNYVGGFIGSYDGVYSTVGDGDAANWANGAMTIKNCWFDGEITAGANSHSVGGFIGSQGGRAKVDMMNCLNTGVVTSTKTSGARTGGFYGWLNWGARYTIQNSLMVGTVNAVHTETAGAFIGQLGTAASYVTITNTYTNSSNACGGNTTWDTTTYLKDRMDIIKKDEAILFPTLATETENAWRNDIGYNDTDRGTPILEYFADWWLSEHPNDGLTERPVVFVDTSWYNDTDTEFTLWDGEDLLGLAQLSAEGKTFEGVTVKLGADIALNTVDDAILEKWVDGSEVPEILWTPVGTEAKPFAGTFVGQGHEISGLYLDTGNESAGLFGYVAYSAQLQNFKLVDSYMKSSASNLGLVGSGLLTKIENVYTNAIIVTEGNYVGGFIGNYSGVYSTVADGDAANWANGTMTIKNCWFDGEITAGANSHSVGGFIGAQDGRAKVDLINCLNTGVVTSTKIETARTGGFYGWLNWGARYTIQNSLMVGTVNAVDTATAGAFIGQLGTSASYVTITNTYTNSNKACGNNTTWDTDTYLKDRMDLIEADEADLFPALTGETENAWVNDVGYNDTDRGTPILKYFAEWWLAENPDEGLTARPDENAPDTSWYTTTDAGAEFTLTTAQQLLGFAELAKTNDFAGQTIKLGADIALNEVDADILASWKAGTVIPARKWSPIGSSSKPFAGTFDGQGYAISGLYLSATTDGAGLFGWTAQAAVLEDFKLVDSYMQSSAAGLGIIGSGNFTRMEKVYTNAVMVSTGNYVGGFLGVAKASNPSGTGFTINNCWFDGEITQTGQYGAAGFVAFDEGNTMSIFNNCLNTGKITGTSKVAGFYGWYNYYGSGGKKFNNCLSVGTVTATGDGGYAGVFFGHITAGSLWGVEINNSYGIGSALCGYIQIGGTIGNADVNLMTRDELLVADEATLFPALTGETDNAWVKDTYYNDTDRGTPILAYFAEWWIARQSTEGLTQTADTSWYNETATEFTLMDAADLLGFAKLVNEGNAFAGKTVKLGADITLNNVNETILAEWKAGTAVPSNKWTAIGTETVPFAGTFNGQGHTISGLYLNATTKGAGLFGWTAQAAVLEDFKLVDSYMQSSADGLGIIGYGNFTRMDKVYTNAVMVSTGNYVGGFLGVAKASNPSGTGFTINNCWFDGEITQTGQYGASGFVAMDEGNTMSIFNNCLNTGKITGTSKVAGFYGWYCYYGSGGKKFNNCLSTGTITATGSGAYKGVFFGDITAGSLWGVEVNNSYGIGDALCGHIQIGGTIGNADVNLMTRDELLVADEATLFPALTGETNNAWVNDAFYTATDRGTPILEYFADWWLSRQSTEGLTEKVDTSWYNETATEFTLTDAEDLIGFAKLVNEGNSFAGKTVKLGADIALNNVNETILAEWKAGTAVASRKWTAIGTETVPFAGTFNGQGHTISGLYLNATSKGAGLFGWTAQAAVLEDFKLVDSYMQSSADGLGIIGAGLCTRIEKVYTNAVMVSTGSFVGGFLGNATASNPSGTGLTINNCWFDGEITQTGQYGAAGFVAGDAGNTMTIFNNCLNTGKITGTSKVAGFYGWYSYYGSGGKKFNNCLSTGTITATGSGAYKGVFFGDITAGSLWGVEVNNSYGIGDALCGHIQIGGSIGNADVNLMTRDELLVADEATLFPALTGETDNAWVADTVQNTTDRGTPILAYFAEWWTARQ